MKCIQSPRVLLGLLCATAAGCGGKVGASPRPSVESCSSRWQAVTDFRETQVPRGLVYSAGEILYVAQLGDLAAPSFRIEAQAAQGGMPRVVAEVLGASDLWVEGDRALYAWSGQLWSVPVAGGEGSLLSQHAAMDYEGMSYALSPVWFVWSSQRSMTGASHSGTVWGVARSGAGTVEELGGTDYTPIGLVLAGDSAIAVPSGGDPASVFSLNGVAARRLASAGNYTAGADQLGIYGYRDWQTASSNRAEMQRAPVEGGPAVPFWTDMPAKMSVERLWPDGNGGWLVSGTEPFEDGAYHRSIFWVGGDGVGVRAACDASAEWGDYWVGARPAFDEDGVYLVNADLSLPDDAQWQIVRVRRP